MKRSIVQDRCPFHLAQHAKHSRQVSVQLSDRPSLSVSSRCPGHGRAPTLGPTHQLQILRILTPCQKGKPSQHLFSLKVLIKDQMKLRHVTKRERQMGREDEAPNKKITGLKGEKMKQRRIKMKRVKTGGVEACSHWASSRYCRVGL